jgi:hypothetical protein
VIGKVQRGRNAGGLIAYLFGPGRSNEHDRPRVVAGWDDPGRLDPPLKEDGRRDLRGLIGGLKAPLAGADDAPERCVWHCSLRAAPDDPVLTDAQWADVAAEVMDRTGLAPRGDDGGCRWVVVRHADDHVHLVVTLARQDGRRAALHNDFYRVGEACRAVEERYGLRVTAGRDRTAARRAGRAEIEKAARLAQPETARDRLRREVQTAAAAAMEEGEFLGRLRAAGVMVRERYSEHNVGERTGYAVAWPGFRNRDGEPVWYGGAKLAADLSLPKLRRHWSNHHPQRRGAGGECVAARVRLRHTVETVAATSHDLSSFLAGLRDAGLLVRERYSQQQPGEITGYAVALPSDTDAAGRPVWYGGAKLAADLSLPRLQAGWETATTATEGQRRPGRVDPTDRPAVWREATDAARNAAAKVRRLAHQDPGAAGAAARAVADLLHVAARVAEPAGRGGLHDAARAYDRASRELHGRTPRSGPGGAELRLAAASLGLLARAGRDEDAAVVALAVALAGLVEAVTDLRAVQGRAEQAAAWTAAQQLRCCSTPPASTGDLAAIARPRMTLRPAEAARREGLRR